MKNFAEYMKNIKTINLIFDENEVDEGKLISISYYCNGVVVDGDILEEIAIVLSEKIKDASRLVDLYYYVWLDAQSGQIRISVNRDLDLQRRFRANIIEGSTLKEILDDIYEEGSIIEKNGGVKIFVFKKYIN